MNEFPHHGRSPKPLPKKTDWVEVGEILIYISFLIILMTLVFTPIFALVDNHIENSIEYVNGTFEEECNYWAGGGLQNSSNPLSWIKVDGNKYIAREVDLERFGDTGKSLIGDFQPGDHIEMELFPYKTYNFWHDSPGMWMIVFIFPAGIASWAFGYLSFRKRGGK